MDPPGQVTATVCNWNGRAYLGDCLRALEAHWLTEQAIAHLRNLNCTKVVLNASDAGEPIYRSLGFVPANEFRLDLTDDPT